MNRLKGLASVPALFFWVGPRRFDNSRARCHCLHMLFPIGFIVVFILVMVLTNRKTRNCRWRANRRNDLSGRAAWFCVACGARTFTTDGKPPRQCHVDNPPPSL